MKFFKNWHIKTQIMSVCMAVVLGISAIGLASLTSHNLNETAYQRQRDTLALARGFDSAHSRLLQIREIEKDFLLKPNFEAGERHAELMEQTVAGLERLAGLPSAGSNSKTIAAINKALIAYETQFQEVVNIRRTIGFTDSTGLHGQFEDAIRSIEGVVAMRNNTRLDVALLRMRRADLNFFLTDDPKFLDQQERHFDSFLAAMAASFLNADDQKLIGDMAKVYVSSTQEVARKLLAEIESRQKLDQLYGQAEPMLRELTAAQNADFDAMAASATSELGRTYRLTLAAIAMVAFFTVFLGLMVGPAISRPLRLITVAMTDLAAGNRDVVVPAKDHRNEIGEMAIALQIFKDGMLERALLRSEQDKERIREIERSRRLEEAVHGFEGVIGDVVGAVYAATRHLEKTARSLSANANETSLQSGAVTAAVSNMSQTIDSVAAAAEQLSTSITEISQQVTNSAQIVRSAVAQAEDTNFRMKGLADAAQKIGAVVVLINEIAGQTNLLALNATIEAARAGEAGKGFAVVASEVKGLAMQTARATEEIAGQIRAIQESSGNSVNAIKSITQTIKRVDDIAMGIASAVEEQGAATQEISRNVQQAAVGTQEVSTNIQGVTEASKLTSSGSTEVLDAAMELAQNGQRLTSEVETFLKVVRSL